MDSPIDSTPKNSSSKCSRPLSVWEALGEEYLSVRGGDADAEYVRLHSAYLKPQAELDAPDANQTAVEKQQCAADEKKFPDFLVSRWHKEPRNALCFSGGGIRSASFCLGVLQALAKYSGSSDSNLFSEFHYLSTVSGGGYTGGWLSSWITRENSTAKVIEELATAPSEKLDSESKPLLYLRNFVSYLNPRLGAFSADSWTLVSTILRNVFLNWLVLIPLLAAVLVLPKLVFAAIIEGGSWGMGNDGLTSLLVVSGILAAVATAYIVYDLPAAINSQRSQSSFLGFCLLPLFLACLGLTFYWSWHIETGGRMFSPFVASLFVVAMVVAGLIVGFFAAIRRGVASKGSLPWAFIILAGISSLGAAAIAAYLGYRFIILIVNGSQQDFKLYTWLAVPTGLTIIGVMQLLTVGLTSKITTDEDREWWARSMAWLSLVVVGWLTFAGIILYGTELFVSSKGSVGVLKLLKLIAPSDFKSALDAAIANPTGTSTMAKVSTVLATLLGTIASRLGYSQNTKAGTRKEEKPSSKLSLTALSPELALKIIVPLFLVFLVIALASIDELLSQSLAVSHFFPWWPEVQRSRTPWAHGPYLPSVRDELLLFVLLLCPALVASIFINVNKFSLHAMYRIRLIRTFLGASNEQRDPNPFTGFDPKDNLAMSELHQGRPLHVVNMALNLVKGDKLAWQQRKAESFTASRLHCGSCRVGYQKSEEYGHADKGFTLGGAIAISGAAASPNMGYHSSPLVTIIMTLFNARLGAWLANPGKAGKGLWNKEGPTYAVRPFIDEAFGLTTDANAWVYLSDGGHFENLGLYEMVLRRCRHIIAVDASADPQFNYEDLGNAVRKIRIDMGIPIEFPGQPPIPSISGEKGPHWAVATIQYSCVDGPGTDGILLYIKPCLNGNEPKDVVAYSKLQPLFPHQSTIDQWFDEPQFESYRRLGFHSVDELFEFSGGTCGLPELIQKACVANGIGTSAIA